MEKHSAIRTKDAAQYVGLSVSTLSKMRLRGDGPTYCKNGPRAVAYRIADLDAWLTANRRQSTSQSAQSI